MKPRDEALKLLLESGITNDLKDIAMVYRIADVLEKVVEARNEETESKLRYKADMERNIAMGNSIRRLIDGDTVYSWDGDED